MPEIAIVEPPSLDEVRSAREGLNGIIVHTPLVPLHDDDCVSSILLKPETLQPVTSFKLRGIYHAVASLTEDQRRQGLSTVSAGNTAQALAWCGRHFGVPARSIMPDSAPQTKIEAVKALGGQPVLVPVAEVFRFLREHGWTDEPYAFIHPWINPHVMTGHGSIALEIIEDFPDVESIFIPVGGGGLIGGVGGTLKAIKPSVKVYAVEPEGCPSLHASLDADRPMSVACDTICDGVAVPYITDEMFPLLREIVDDALLVPESSVKSMTRRLALRDKLVVEPSGALAAAAAIRMPEVQRGRCVCIVTGGSLDADTLVALLQNP